MSRIVGTWNQRTGSWDWAQDTQPAGETLATMATPGTVSGAECERTSRRFVRKLRYNFHCQWVPLRTLLAACPGTSEAATHAAFAADSVEGHRFEHRLSPVAGDNGWRDPEVRCLLIPGQE